MSRTIHMLRFKRKFGRKDLLIRYAVRHGMSNKRIVGELPWDCSKEF